MCVEEGVHWRKCHRVVFAKKRCKDAGKTPKCTLNTQLVELSVYCAGCKKLKKAGKPTLDHRLKVQPLPEQAES